MILRRTGTANELSGRGCGDGETAYLSTARPVGWYSPSVNVGVLFEAVEQVSPLPETASPTRVLIEPEVSILRTQLFMVSETY